MDNKTIATFLLLSGAAIALSGCTVTEADAARVDCGTPGPHGVDYTVQRTAGNGTFDSCWELSIDCRNGGGMNGSACHTLAAGATTGEQNMPVSSFSGQETCDVPASGRVERLEVTTRS